MEKDFILVVDDKAENRTAAQTYLHSAGLDGIVVSDYAEAMAVLDSGAHIDGVITDCFFPEETGSSRKELVRQTIEQILAGAYGGKLDEASGVVTREELADRTLEEYGKVATLESHNGRLRTLLTNRILYSIKDENGYTLEEDGLLRAVRGMSKRLGPDKAAEHLLEGLESALIYDRPPQIPGGHDELAYVSRMSYGLRKYGETAEENQPLGVLVAEEAVARGIPALILSSASHHATNMQPIYDYYRKKLEESPSGERLGWEIMADMDPRLSSQEVGKDNPQAWARAYQKLLLEVHLPAGGERWKEYHRRRDALERGEQLSLRTLGEQMRSA